MDIHGSGHMIGTNLSTSCPEMFAVWAVLNYLWIHHLQSPLPTGALPNGLDSKACTKQVATNMPSHATLQIHNKFDIESEIKILQYGLPINFSYHWVKVHQDETLDQEDLYTDVSLNIIANSLSTNQRQKPPLQHEDHQLPHKQVSLWIKGKKIHCEID